jgi:hypothetical protein
LCGLALTAARADDEKKPAPAGDKPAAKLDRAALEKEFQETMSGCVLDGHFAIDGPEGKQTVSSEKYTINKVSKLKGDTWLFEARIQYGGNDVTVPIPLNVFWAGDTPVISLTDVTIPGLGTFTSRVMVYRGRYAGTWQHGEIGGQLWGRIKKDGDASKKDKNGDVKKPDGNSK